MFDTCPSANYHVEVAYRGGFRQPPVAVKLESTLSLCHNTCSNASSVMKCSTVIQENSSV